MKPYVYLVVFLMGSMFQGCGGGGGGSGTSSVTMTPNQSYTVYPGDELIKQAPDTVVQISHTQGIASSEVILLEGQATIIYH